MMQVFIICERSAWISKTRVRWLGWRNEVESLRI